MIEIIPNWHPIFVHFTVALLSISLPLFIVSYLTSNTSLASQWDTAGRWNLWLGTGITVLTVLAGWYAFNTVKHDTPSHEIMVEHRNLAIVTLLIFLVITIWSIVRYQAKKGKSWLFVAALLVGVGMLTSTAWHGGELVYRHGLGVMSLPKPESAGHEHAHSHEHGDSGAPQEMNPAQESMGEEEQGESMHTEEAQEHSDHPHDHEQGTAQEQQ
jgi:uncharacterized membrane protein